jgi:hypothetical protein
MVGVCATTSLVRMVNLQSDCQANASAEGDPRTLPHERLEMSMQVLTHTTADLELRMLSCRMRNTSLILALEETLELYPTLSSGCLAPII